MDKRIERSIDENQKLSEEFRTIAKTCFGRIFDMLGKRNFERWINKRELSSRIKELVIESMDADDEKKFPNWAGYYTRNTNRIRLRKGSKSDVATHEKFHFMTDGGEYFPTFINEGLTEYMKGMADGGANTYTENVATVKFLHEMFGDSIIKAYLLGRPRVLNEKIALALVDGNLLLKNDGIKDVNDFYDNLDTFHTYIDADDKYKQALRESSKYTQDELDKMQEDARKSKEAYEQIKDRIPEMFGRITTARISQMAKNLEFYRDGKFDAEFASKTIEEMVKSIPLEYFEKDLIKRETLKLEFMKSAAREIVKNSHLVARDESDTKIETFANKLIPDIKITKTQVTRSPSKIKNDDPSLKIENDEMIQKLLYIATKDEKTDVATYLERIAKLQEKFNISDLTLEYILTKHNSDKFSDSPALGIINKSIIKSFPLFRTLSKISDARQQDTIESTYRSIGQNRYLEIRDNQRFFIEIGRNGEIYEEELKYGHSVIFRGRDRLDISYKSGMEDFEVSDRNGKIKPGITLSLQELKELEFGKTIVSNISEKTKNGEFFTILDDAPTPFSVEGMFFTNEVDTRSRKVDWDKFLGTIEDYSAAIPESVRLYLIQQINNEMLDITYGFGPKKLPNGAFGRMQDVADIHFEAYDHLAEYFKKDANPSEKEYAKRKLTTLSDKVNTLRKERVSENAKTALLTFKTPEARDKYFKLQNEKIQKRIEKSVQDFPYGEYIEAEDNEENLAFMISGVYTTADIDTRNRTLLVDEFAKGTKELLETIPKEQKQKVFDTIFSRMIGRAYGIGEKQLKQNSQLQEHFDLVKNAVSKNVFEGEILNKESLKESLEEFNLFHINQARENRKESAVAFRDDNARKMYELVASLLERGNISSEDIQSHAKKLIEIHNASISKETPSKSNKNTLEDK